MNLLPGEIVETGDHTKVKLRNGAPCLRTQAHMRTRVPR